MTKKDYELIAESIKSFIVSSEKIIGEAYDYKTVLYLAGWIAQDLKNSNDKFNTEKFTAIILKANKQRYGN